MSDNRITVIIPTYNRFEILKETVRKIAQNLIFRGGIDVLVGNDGDDLSHTFVPDCYSYHSNLVKTIIITGPKRGLGANLNNLIGAARTDVVLQMDDDHWLDKPLDITQYVQDLADFKNQVGWVRLFLGTEEDLNNDDPFYKFTATMHERYWYPVPGAGELYIPSNRPHLKHKNFHGFHGYYEEGLKLGKTEEEFCHDYQMSYELHWSHPDFPWVVIPVAAPPFDTWRHVGDSWQRQGL